MLRQIVTTSFLLSLLTTTAQGEDASAKTQPSNPIEKVEAMVVHRQADSDESTREQMKWIESEDVSFLEPNGDSVRPPI